MKSFFKFPAVFLAAVLLLAPAAMEAREVSGPELTLEQLVGNFTNPNFPYQSAVTLLMGWVYQTLDQEIQKQTKALRELQQGGDAGQIQLQQQRLDLLIEKRDNLRATMTKIVDELNVATNGVPPARS